MHDEVQRLFARLRYEGIGTDLAAQIRAEHVLAALGLLGHGEEEAVAALDADEADSRRVRRALRSVFAKSIEQAECFERVFTAWVRQVPRSQLDRGADDFEGVGVISSARSTCPTWIWALAGLTLVICGLGTSVWWHVGAATDGGGLIGESGPKIKRIAEMARSLGLEAEHLELQRVQVPVAEVETKPKASEEIEAGQVEADVKQVQPESGEVKAEAEQREPRPDPIPLWRPLLALLAMSLTAGIHTTRLLRARLPRRPWPLPRTPRQALTGLRPPHLPAYERVFMEREHEKSLIWGVERYRSEELTGRLDVARTVIATAARGGAVELRYTHAHVYRGVWLWLDRRTLHAEDALCLVSEIESTLKTAELPVHRAYFDGVMDTVELADRRASPLQLGDLHHHARVAVFTDGTDFLAAPAISAATAELLSELASWEGLAVVTLGGRVRDLAALLSLYGVTTIAPNEVVDHLAGTRTSPGGVAGADARIWEAACALAGRAIDEAEAHMLRTSLQLDVSPWAIRGLRAVAPGPPGKIDWSPSRRCGVLTDLERMERLPPAGSLLPQDGIRARALGFWQTRHDILVEAWAAREPTWNESDRGRLVIVAGAALDLWLRPERAIRVLYELHEGDAPDGAVRERVREVLSGYVDRDGDPGEMRVRLPWRFRELAVEQRLMLGNLDFPNAREVVTGRTWPYGLVVATVVLGLGGVVLGSEVDVADRGETGIYVALMGGVLVVVGACVWGCLGAAMSGLVHGAVALLLLGRVPDTESMLQANQGQASNLPEESTVGCPRQMALIPGGSLGGHVIEDVCMDLTEVSVAAFRSWVQESNRTVLVPLVDSDWALTAKAKLDRLCNASRKGRGSHPMNCVDWQQADAYCSSQGGRLPTEFEWRWAAGGRERESYYTWGEQEPSAAHANACGAECIGLLKSICAVECQAEFFKQGPGTRMFEPLFDPPDGWVSTAWVGMYPAGQSRDGLSDMFGNVAEWTSSPDPGGPWLQSISLEFGRAFVVLGGSWASTLGSPLSDRESLPESFRLPTIGFRCARSAR